MPASGAEDALVYSFSFPVRDLTIHYQDREDPLTDFFKVRASTPGGFAPPVPHVRPEGALNQGDWVFGKSVWHRVFYDQRDDSPVYMRCNYNLRFDHKNPYIWRNVEGATPIGPLCKGCTNQRNAYGQRSSSVIVFKTDMITDPVLRARVERRIKSRSQLRYRFEIAQDDPD